ncbi:MAG: hypothetical protein HGA49_12080 [Eubacteriaceae bacterium]|nr:hypothetical protein [Eubacteriaceae bacterium]
MNSDNSFYKSEKKFIAFIDILGFSDLVKANPDLADFAKIYGDIFQPLSHERQAMGINHRLFSDSLFLTSEKRTLDRQLKCLIIFAQKLMNRAIMSGLPIRGCISYGDMILKGDVVVGKPIIDAVKQEGMQEWLGIILSPNCLEYREFFDIIRQMEKDKQIIPYENITIKGTSEKFIGYVVNIIENLNQEDHIIASLNKMRLMSSSVNIQKKYTETIKFVEYASRVLSGKERQQPTFAHLQSLLSHSTSS